MASRLTVALMRTALGSSLKESRRYDPISRASQSASATSQASFDARSLRWTASSARSHARSAGRTRAVRARADGATRRSAWG